MYKKFKTLKSVCLYILAFVVLINTTSCYWLVDTEDTKIRPDDEVYSVKGYVLDGQNQPISDIKLTLYERDEYHKNFRIIKGEAQTDDKGLYKIDFACHQKTASDYRLEIEFDQQEYNANEYMATSGDFSFDDLGGSNLLDFNIYLLKYKESQLHYETGINAPKNLSLFYESRSSLLIDGKPYSWKRNIQVVRYGNGGNFLDRLRIPYLTNRDVIYEINISLYYDEIGNGSKKIICKEDTIKLNLNDDIPSQMYYNDETGFY